MRAEAVIDADGHVLEPREAWKDLDVSIRPRIETDARGLDHVIVGDDDVFVAKLGQMYDPAISTISGIHVGSTVDEVLATYPGASTAELPNAISITDTRGRVILFVLDNDAVTGMVLSTDRDKIALHGHC
jgi:hypothetical protein